MVQRQGAVTDLSFMAVNLVPKLWKEVLMQGRLILYNVLLILSISLLNPFGGYAQGSLPESSQQIKASELKLLLQTLENPQKRAKFIKQLKLLIALQEKKLTPISTEKEKPALGEDKLKVTNIFLLYQKLLQRLNILPYQLRESIKDFSIYVSSLRQYFSKKENIYFVLDLVIKFFLASLFGLVIFFYLHRRLRRFEYSWELEDKVSLRDKIGTAAVKVGIGIMPFVSLLLFWLVFAFIVDLEVKIRNIVSLTITIILVARGLSSILDKILAPQNSYQRLIPCPDELAAYFSLWTKRLIYYSAYGYLPLGIGAQSGLGEAVLLVFWTIYKLGLIVLAAIFILPWKDTIKGRLSMEEEGGAIKQSLIRGYNLVLGKLYVVLIIYFLGLLTIAVFGYTSIALHLIFRMFGTLLIISLGVGLWQLAEFLSHKLLFIIDWVKERFPGFEDKLAKYISFIRIAINISVLAAIIILIFEVWGIDLRDFVLVGIGIIIIKRMVSIALTLMLALLVIDISQYFIRKVLMEKTEAQDRGIELSKRVKTFLPLFNNLVKYTTFFVAGMIILGQLGIDITPILAGAGVIGLAVGFGAQSLVKDVISGFFILFEDLISVGDVVVIKGTGGLVEEVNLRTVKMRDLAGNVHVFPNSNIDMVTNMTKDYSRYVIDLGVSYREDVDEVIKVVKEIGEELQADPNYGPNILEPLEVLGVDDFGESQVTIKLRITTKPIKQWEVGRELKRRIKKTFDAKGIEIPFPHRTIYWGDPKYTPPQPLVIKLETTPAYISKEEQNPAKGDQDK
jgi:small conductance mechanosensitive channel